MKRNNDDRIPIQFVCVDTTNLCKSLYIKNKFYLRIRKGRRKILVYEIELIYFNSSKKIDDGGFPAVPLVGFRNHVFF